MMDDYAEKFEGLCNLMAVLNYILFAIGGFVIGVGCINLFAGIIFALISIPIALLCNIFTFGFIAQIITINNRVDDLYAVLKKEIAPACRTISENSKSTETPVEVKTESVPVQKQLYQPDTYIPPSTTWKCKKCGAVNPINSTSCKDCGSYK